MCVRLLFVQLMVNEKDKYSSRGLNVGIFKVVNKGKTHRKIITLL